MHAFAGWRRRRAVLRLGRLGTVESVRCLAEVFLDSADDEVAGLARQALAELADPDAWDVVFELAIATGDKRLTELVSQSGRLPSDPRRRVLWLVLDRRHERAAELDFDGSLLRAAYATAGPELRKRIAANARAAGRVEWIRPRSELPVGEWDDALAVLTAGGRYDELWRLAPLAPLPWSARILRTLGELSWQPETDRDGYARLLELAGHCRSPLSTAALFASPRELARGFRELSGHAISTRGDLLATAHHIKFPTVLLWHLPSGEPAGRFTHDRTSVVAGKIALTPDGSTVAAGVSLSEVLLWSRSTGRQLASLTSERWDTITALEVTPDGELLIAASDFRLLVWQLSSGALLWSRSPFVHDTSSLATTPDGRLLATGGYAEHGNAYQVRLWQLPAMKRVGAVYVDKPGVRSLFITPDGRVLVTVGVAGTTRSWQLPSLVPIATMSYKARSSTVAMSADGTLLAGLNPAAAAVEVRGVRTGELVTSIDADAMRVQGREAIGRFALSGDGRLLLGADNLGGPIHVWHLPSGEPAGELPSRLGGAEFLSFAPNGAVIAGASQGTGTVTMWQPEPALSGGVPLAQATLDDVERLRHKSLPPGDLRWLELACALVRWRHRNDIDLAGSTGSPVTTDIELAGPDVS